MTYAIRPYRDGDAEALSALSLAAINVVVARAYRDKVLTFAAIYCMATVLAKYAIPLLPTEDRVLAITRIDQIIASAAVDCVRAAMRLDRIVVRPPKIWRYHRPHRRCCRSLPDPQGSRRRHSRR